MTPKLTPKHFIDLVEEWTGDIRVTPLIEYVMNLPGFFRLPASINEKHHTQAGGLALHTWEVLNFSKEMASSPLYGSRKVQREILAVGAVWCDMGKTFEYRLMEQNQEPLLRPGLAKDYGCTHIMMALMEWGAMPMRMPEGEEYPFSTAEHYRVAHCIAGHHGKLEWGSPVVPNSREAIILHHADIQSIMLSGAKNPEMRREPEK